MQTHPSETRDFIQPIKLRDGETHSTGKQIALPVIHSFPSASVLEIAVAKLMPLQEQHLNLAPNPNVKRLLARHSSGLGPQAPMKPAA
jgi:hypothetical protein